MTAYDEHFDDALNNASTFGDDEPTCNKCGDDGLHWECKGYTPAGKEIWRLFEADGTQHECKRLASSDEFEAL